MFDRVKSRGRVVPHIGLDQKAAGTNSVECMTVEIK